MKIQKSKIAILVLNQSSISAVHISNITVAGGPKNCTNRGIPVLTSLDLNAQGEPRNWSDNGHWRMLIGTNTKSQLQQLNSYCFVLRGYKCTRCTKQFVLHFVAFFHVASLFSTAVDNEKVGVDNKKALELDKRIFFLYFSLISM